MDATTAGIEVKRQIKYTRMELRMKMLNDADATTLALAAQGGGAYCTVVICGGDVTFLEYTRTTFSLS